MHLGLFLVKWPFRFQRWSIGGGGRSDVKVWFYDGRTTTAAPRRLIHPSPTRHVLERNLSEAEENQAAAAAALADCANSIWSASLALFLVAAGDSEFGSAVRSFLTSYFPDCRALSCFLEVSPSEKDPPISHVTLFSVDRSPVARSLLRYRLPFRYDFGSVPDRETGGQTGRVV